MKKNITSVTVILYLLLLCNNGAAQNIFPASGRAGIYITSPAASLQVKGGARIGTTANYVNIDSATGNLSFGGTSAYRVAGNKYAFQYSGNTNYGLFFNSTNVQYEFRNGSAVPVFSVNANTGNSVFNGTLKVGAYTFPVTDGTSGQVLKTNGTGVLTWSNDNGGSGSGWSLTGNAGTNPATNFIGTTDAQPLVFRVKNVNAGFLSINGNIFWGQGSGNSNTQGYSNVAIGVGALYQNTTRSNLVAIGDSALFNNGTGATYSSDATYNTAIGSKALYSNTTGYNNTANGSQALRSNTTGYYNTANGSLALYSNKEGLYNTANGSLALYSNKDGAYNTANGATALYFNTTGSENTANGALALYNNTTGYINTANGALALSNNTTGYLNTANGGRALYQNTIGDNNTANGAQALYTNTTGANNTATGSTALQKNTTSSNNTANGWAALYSNNGGNGNTAVGAATLNGNVTGNDNTATGFGALNWNNADNNTANGAYALYSNNGGSGNIALGAFAGQTITTGSNNIFIGYHADASGIDLTNATAIGAYAIVSQSNSLVLGSNARVGIGTSVPHYKLDVLHSEALGAHIASATGSGVFSALDIDADNGDAALRFQKAGVQQWNIRNRPTDNYLEIFELDGGGSRLVIQDATGYVGIGKITPTALLSVNGTADKPGGGSWAVFSDARLKENVKQFTEGLDQIMKINPVKFHYNMASGFDTKPEYVGVLAQDLQKVAPYMVSEISMSTDGSKGNLQADKNSSTNVSSLNINATKKQQFLQVDNSAMTYMLINAVKELKNQVDTKDAQIDLLQKQFNALKLLLLSIQQKQEQCGSCDTSVSEQTQSSSTILINGVSLQQNIPNPFTHNTTIGYTLPQKFSNAQIAITDKNGKTLKAINVSGNSKGSVIVDASTLASGAYQYSLIVDGKLIATKQMVLAK